MNDEFVEKLYDAVTRAERLIARAAAAGGGEFLPLLADIRALARERFDASFRAAAGRLHDAFPYSMDKFNTWIARSSPELEARLRAAGAPFGNTSEATIHQIDSALGDIVRWVARASFVPSREVLRAAASADPTERTLDVGRHRLYFLKAEHGGGLVIDDGWYVPAGPVRAAKAVPQSGDHDYLLVETEPSPETRSPRGLWLVDARNYRYSRVTTAGVPLEAVELRADGLRLPDAERVVRYDGLSFTRCARR